MSRRKTLLANEISQFIPDVVDDDAEKRQRRQSGRFDAPNASIRNQRINRIQDDNLNNTSGNRLATSHLVQAQQVPAAPKPSNEQLSVLYNNCVKLLNENKINAKNAFQLKLIDYMSDIVLNKEIVGGTTNFQVVGCTIDVGTKIYAARVDALHQNTYQMLSGLAHGSGENGESNDQAVDENGETNANDDDNMGDNEDQQKKAKAKKKRVKKSSQIVENLETISAKMRDDFSEEDFYFSKISTCIETEAIGGILLNKLHYRDDSGTILINKDDRVDPNTPEYEHEGGIEVNMKEVCDFYKAKSIDLRNLKLCSDLSNFKFIGWNVDNKNDEISRLVDNMTAVEDNLEQHRFDVNDRNTSLLNATSQHRNSDIDIDMDDNMENMDVDYGGGNDSNDAITNDSKIQYQNGMELFDKIGDLKSMHSLADLTTLISNSPSDYSYFNFDKIKLTDLPKHLKRIANQISSDDQQASQQQHQQQKITATAKNKKEAPRVDFNLTGDLMKYFKVTKKAIYLCDKTLEKRSEKPLRLETERQFDFNARELFQPFEKAVPAKFLTDCDSVENLLVGDEIDLHKNPIQVPRNHEGLNDDDDNLGGIGDDFEIPCSAQTNEPFFTQADTDYNPSQQIDFMHQNSHMHHQLMMMPQSEINEDDLNALRFEGDNLVQAPLQVNALNIEYAKTSKHIDVRRLKQIIWSILCSEHDKENTNESVNNSTSNDDNMSKSRMTTSANVNSSLRTVYRLLKPPLISQRVFDDLSVCIVFQILLFLANEHNLSLKNDPIGSDVVITSVI